MTDIITSQSIDFFSWDTLYAKIFKLKTLFKY